MADESHLRELLKGVKSWNAWRKANPDMKPDLSGIDLTLEAVRGTVLAKIDNEEDEYVDLSWIDFHEVNLQSANLRYAKLQEADLGFASLQDSDLAFGNFQDANLEHANLQSANFFGANLCGTNLEDVNLQGAALDSANLQSARLWRANLQNAALHGAQLERTLFSRANLQGAGLVGANLRGAGLSEANLENTVLWHADFSDANVSRVKFCRSSLQRNFKSIRVTTCYGSQAFKSFAQDQDFIEELRFNSPVKFWLWYIFADCGRSFSLWAAWSLGFATLFGYLYNWMGPQHFHVDRLPFELSSMIYYSIVTFTTLGFGDIKPATVEGSFVVMIEVLLGYVMLGGLISILANKLARRA